VKTECTRWNLAYYCNYALLTLSVKRLSTYTLRCSALHVANAIETPLLQSQYRSQRATQRSATHYMWIRHLSFILIYFEPHLMVVQSCLLMWAYCPKIFWITKPAACHPVQCIINIRTTTPSRVITSRETCRSKMAGYLYEWSPHVVMCFWFIVQSLAPAL